MKNLIHHTNHLTIYAIILLAIGLSLRYIIGRRNLTAAALLECNTLNLMA